MLAALGEFDDPEVKKAVIEIAQSDDYPSDIRKKAIDNLAAFNDPSVVIGLLPMLEDKDNYIYYDNIINMVYALGEEKKNAEFVRRMAHKAHFSKKNMIRFAYYLLFAVYFLLSTNRRKRKQSLSFQELLLTRMGTV